MNVEREENGPMQQPSLALPLTSSSPLDSPGSIAVAKPKILIADDDPVIRTHLSRFMEKWGYEVITTGDGTDAFQLLQGKDAPLIAILDWEMPGMEGPEICRQVRAQVFSRYIYIMLMTARKGSDTVLFGLKSGADECFIKPIPPPELRARLETATRICYQRALLASEERFHNAVEHSAVGMALADLSGRWLQINQAFSDFFGYEKQELLQKTFRELTHPDDLAESVREFEMLRNRAKTSFQIEKRYIHRGGHTIWALLTVSMIVNSNSRPPHLIAQIQDISARKRAEEQLRESESLFRAITENAEELIALLDPHGLVQYASPSYQRWLGYRPEELLNTRGLQGLVHPDDLAELLQTSKLLFLPDATTANAIVRLRHKNRGWHHVEGHASVLRDKHGRVERFVITARIIDDWIAAQEVLKDREEQRQLLLDSTAEAIYGLDREGKCTFCNKAFLTLLGYSRADELLGLDAHMMIHHHHEDGSPYPVEECRLRVALTVGKPIHVDDEVLWRADGTYIPVEYWSHPVVKNDELVGAVVTFIDITERKKAETALRLANRESELVINSVPSILVSLDAGGRITEWNIAAEETFGVLKHEVLGIRLADCGIEWSSEDAAAEIDSWMHAGTVKRYENIRFRRDGKTRFLGITVSPVRQQSNDAWRLLITGADTTERKLLEEQLKQAQKLEAIGQLAAGIAHEINTPIQYIGDNAAFLDESWHAILKVLNASQSMRSNLCHSDGEAVALFDHSWQAADICYIKDEIPRAIAQSIDGVRRVAKIVQAMREFSHPGGEEKLAIDINHAVETTVTVARNEWRYVADVKMDLDRTMPLVPCHEGEFNQAILNLIINASHAIANVVGDGSSGRGTITVSSRCDGEWAEVSIQDTGKGIPEKVRSRIFEPFFTTKPIGKGTGQGLALAHAVVVKKHGGKIWFETAQEKGTTFFIRLPLCAAETKE